MPITETTTAAAALLIKATILAAKWAGIARRRALGSAANNSDDERSAELAILRDRVEQLELQVAILRKHVGKRARCPRYNLGERLHVLWFIEVFQIPRRKVTHHCGIARSTLYRWLHKIDNASPTSSPPGNKTPIEIAALVWEIARANMQWGRVRIANQLGLLGTFIAASTVRSILTRPKPPTGPEESGKAADKPEEEQATRLIPASYPNHVWLIDRTTVLRWGL